MKNKPRDTAVQPPPEEDTQEEPTLQIPGTYDSRTETYIKREHLVGVERAYFALCGLEYIFRNAPPGRDFDGNKNYHNTSFLLRLIIEKMKPAMDAM